MRFLYFVNVALLSFALTVLAGTLRVFSSYPEVFYAGLGMLFVILIIGILPYRVRARNPVFFEFLTIFAASIMGVLLWS